MTFTAPFTLSTDFGELECTALYEEEVYRGETQDVSMIHLLLGGNTPMPPHAIQEYFGDDAYRDISRQEQLAFDDRAAWRREGRLLGEFAA